jgi:hypothetical protein
VKTHDPQTQPNSTACPCGSSAFDFFTFASQIYKERSGAHATPYLLPALYGGELGPNEPYEALFILQDNSGPQNSDQAIRLKFRRSRGRGRGDDDNAKTVQSKVQGAGGDRGEPRGKDTEPVRIAVSRCTRCRSPSGGRRRWSNCRNCSWMAENAQIVLTGGGANMPNIKALADRPWELGGKRLHFRRAVDIPEFISTNFDANFQREYPQFAVAIGGVLPVLDEKSRLEEYWGSALKPGPLTTYQVTGI